MKRASGFTLIELLIVVAIIGIVAAIAIPALLRARVAANESATVGDIRTVLSAQSAYQAANAGMYASDLGCLVAPSQGAACIANYPADGPRFIDSSLASLQPKSGYDRSFSPEPPSVPAAGAGTNSTWTYAYRAVPSQVGRTGVRAFAGAANGVICTTPDGSTPPVVTAGRVDFGTCTILQ